MHVVCSADDGDHRNTSLTYNKTLEAVISQRTCAQG